VCVSGVCEREKERILQWRSCWMRGEEKHEEKMNVLSCVYIFWTRERTFSRFSPSFAMGNPRRTRTFSIRAPSHGSGHGQIKYLHFTLHQIIFIYYQNTSTTINYCSFNGNQLSFYRIRNITTTHMQKHSITNYSPFKLQEIKLPEISSNSSK